MDPEDPTGPEDEWGQWRPVEGGPPMAPPPPTAPMPPVPPTMPPGPPTLGWTQTITKNQSGLARSSAEVITEAPSSTSGVLPLADFGKVNYSVSAANGTSLGSQHPTEIIMVDNHGAPKDSTSAISSTGAFSNTWIRSN